MVCLPVPPPGLTAVSTHTTRLRFAGKHLDGRLQGFFGAGAVFFVGAGGAPGVAFFSAGTGDLSDGPALLAGEVSLPSFGTAGAGCSVAAAGSASSTGAASSVTPPSIPRPGPPFFAGPAMPAATDLVIPTKESPAQ